MCPMWLSGLTSKSNKPNRYIEYKCFPHSNINTVTVYNGAFVFSETLSSVTVKNKLIIKYTYKCSILLWVIFLLLPKFHNFFQHFPNTCNIHIKCTYQTKLNLRAPIFTDQYSALSNAPALFHGTENFFAEVRKYLVLRGCKQETKMSLFDANSSIWNSLQCNASPSNVNSIFLMFFINRVFLQSSYQ